MTVSTEGMADQHFVSKEEQVIASRLLHLRETLGISREELASVVDIEEEELKNYEYGVEPVPASALLVIAGALGFDINYFYYDQTEELAAVQSVNAASFTGQPLFAN